jgi:hypothetical protein
VISTDVEYLITILDNNFVVPGGISSFEGMHCCGLDHKGIQMVCEVH